MCGTCASGCPVQAIGQSDTQYRIDPSSCIDCGTCSTLCSTGAIHPSPYIRESISQNEINMDKCYFNPGCALSLYKPDVPEKMQKLLQAHLGSVKFHNICCRHDPALNPAQQLLITVRDAIGGFARCMKASARSLTGKSSIVSRISHCRITAD